MPEEKNRINPETQRRALRGKNLTDKYLRIFLIIIISIIVFLYAYRINKPEKVEICFNDACIKAEVADTPEERAVGLMHRENLKENEGLLFKFEREDRHSFWMKNTLIPLVIIWIDSNYTIVDMESMKPCSDEPCKIYTPSEPAKYALEVSIYFTEKNNINIGDSVDINK